MRNPPELGKKDFPSTDFIAVSWNLHKGRSPIGRQVWKPMQDWLASTGADACFLQEAMSKRMPAPLMASSFGAPTETPPADAWLCQATEIATALKMQLTLGQNVFKASWRHGNAILSPHPLDLGGRWDISAHRFERRGLLVARMTFNGKVITLLCAHLALTRSARLRQMLWIAEWIAHGAPDGPLILAGDFNDWKNDSVPIFAEAAMREVATELGVSGRTFPAFSPALALDKMFVRGLTPVEWVAADQRAAWLSDHLPYIARLRLDP
jgi:endonuclease/exonuclease/phosphatase family metal-dependent hydrolase